MNIQTEAELIELVKVHQNFMSGGKIVEIADRLPTELKETTQGQLLQAVSYYHQQHQLPDERKDWVGAYKRFLCLTGDEPFTDFYSRNYAFLSGRNAKRPFVELLPQIQNAREIAAEMHGKVYGSQLTGFILYNFARFLWAQGEKLSALSFWIDACEARLEFYQNIKHRPDPLLIKEAATQLWKTRFDWEKFFPGISLELCPLDDELFQEVAALADPEFSAAKHAK